MKRSLLFLSFVAAATLVACSSSSDDVIAQPTNADAGPPATSPSPANPGESNNSKKEEKDPSTDIVFGVDAENFKSEGYNFTSYTIEVKVDGKVAASETLPVDSSKPTPLPHETKVVAPKDKLDAEVEITVKAVMNDADVVTRRATTHFVKGKSLLAYIRLEVRCNNFGLLGGSGISGPTCDKPQETCVGGKCVSQALDAATLPAYRLDWATNPPSACGNGTASSVILGTGQTAIAAINDNDTLQVECGPQGGHHLWMALSMKDVAQAGTTTTFTATGDSGAITIPPSAYPYSWAPAANGSCELVALRFQLDAGGVNIKDVLGKSLDVQVIAEDKSGRKATATRHINISPDRAGGPMCRPLM